MVEPREEKAVDAESEEMIEMEELVRAKDAKGKAKPDEEDAPASPTT